MKSPRSWMRYAECGRVMAQSQFELGLVTSAAGSFFLRMRLYTVNLCEVASVVQTSVLNSRFSFKNSLCSGFWDRLNTCLGNFQRCRSSCLITEISYLKL